MSDDSKYWPGNRPPRSVQTPIAKSDDLIPEVKGKLYRIKGVDVELFSIGDLACLLGKRPVTVRMWESKGWIPKANWRSPTPKGQQIPGREVKGRRLYTRAQVELLKEASIKYRIDDKSKGDWAGFKQYIRSNWPL